MNVAILHHLDIFASEVKLVETSLPDGSLFEMADSIKKYKRDIRNIGAQLYEHLMFIFVLGNRLPYLEHWKREIKAFCKPVYTTTLKKCCSNADMKKYVREEMMSHYMGINFEDYDISQFEKTLDLKIRTGEKHLKDEAYKQRWPNIRRELAIIKDVRQHLDGVPEKCLDSFKQFYDVLVESAGKCDMDMLNRVIDTLQPVIE